MSSFTECEEALFDDSGLLKALDQGDAFGPAIDDKLRLLERKLGAVDEAQPVEDLLADARLHSCRLLAAEILGDLGSKSRAGVTGGPQRMPDSQS